MEIPLLRTILAPAVLLVTPAIASAAPVYEPLRAPAGKTVTMWRLVDRPASTTVTCPPDSTKAFWCLARKAEADRAARPQEVR